MRLKHIIAILFIILSVNYALGQEPKKVEKEKANNSKTEIKKKENSPQSNPQETANTSQANKEKTKEPSPQENQKKAKEPQENQKKVKEVPLANQKRKVIMQKRSEMQKKKLRTAVRRVQQIRKKKR